MRGSAVLLDAQQKLQRLWQGAPISQLANGAEISVCFHFYRENRFHCRDVRTKKLYLRNSRLF